MSKEYKIFCGERIFVISDDEKKCFKSDNGIGTIITDAKQLIELLDLFERSEIGELYGWSDAPKSEMQRLRKNNRSIDAAGGLVFNSEGNMLLIRRLGCWDLPKGKIEKGETETVAACREIEEECGITGVKIVRKLTETHHAYKIGETTTVKRTVWFEAMYCGNQTPQPQTEEGISEIIWIRPDSINDYLPGMYASLREIFEENQRFSGRRQASRTQHLKTIAKHIHSPSPHVRADSV